MNGKKWVITAVIMVVVLFLTACVLSAVAVFKAIDELEYRYDSRYEEREDEEEVEEPEETVAEEAPTEEVPETVAPATEPEVGPVVIEGSGEYRLGLVLFHTGEYTDYMVETFAEVCTDMDVSGQIIPCTSGAPLEVMERAVILMESGVDALAVSCPDPDISEELATIAADMGIVYIALDAAMDLPYISSATLNIDAWGSPSDVALGLIGQMGFETDHNCNFAILSSMEEDPVVDIMLGMLENKKYKDTSLVAWGYGDGSLESCMEQAACILEAQMPEVLICTDPQATEGAARIIAEGGFDVRLIGFGVPSQLEDWLVNALIYYHDPKDVGELTARAMIGILEGTLALDNTGVVKLKGGSTYGLAEWEETAVCGTGPISFTEEMVIYFSWKY